MQKARKGQWLILSGIILAVGLVSLTTLLNEALSAGYKVALSETEFPAHEINEIYEETVRTAKLVWEKNKNNFNQSMEYFSENVSKIYALHGFYVSISAYNSTENIANLTIQFRCENVNFTLGPDRLIQLRP